MKATELRIGNYVKCYVKGITDRFDTVQLNIYHLTDICKQIKDYKYEPIPLTEEWLLKFGFQDTDSYFNLLDFPDFRITWSVRVVESGERKNFWLDENFLEVFQQNIKHVHQLQNLYFALTGEELEIKDKDE